MSPCFDIKQLIVQSVEQRHIVLTIPWITEYLAMLDLITLKLPYYISVNKMLFHLYKNYNQFEKNCSCNTLLVKFSLGWLFELPHFPDSEFFTYLYATDDFQINLENSDNAAQFLDNLKIVDQHILYTFCPYLEEIKKLLLTDATNNNTTVKHITPVTTILSGDEVTKRKAEVSVKKIEIGNFFFKKLSVNIAVVKFSATVRRSIFQRTTSICQKDRGVCE